MRTAEQPTAREKHFREMAVWHEWPNGDEEQEHRLLRPNVSSMERAASLIGGGLLAAYGLKRRGMSGLGLATAGGMLIARGATGFCTTYRVLGINTATHGHAEPIDYYEYGIQVTKAVTINASPESLYRFWRDFTNLPAIMSHLESVEIVDDLVSHWTAKGPMGRHIEWDAEIINEEPHELIAWRSLPGAAVDNAGSVRFVRAPGGRGTQLRVNIEYIPAAGKLGSLIAKMFGEEPNQQVREDLRRFKQIMEAGEAPTTEGQPRGQCSGRGVESGRRAEIQEMTTRRGDGYSGESRSGFGGRPGPHGRGGRRFDLMQEEPE